MTTATAARTRPDIGIAVGRIPILEVLTAQRITF